jgi:enoyl-CoA hydratase
MGEASVKVLVEAVGAVTVFTINRPERRNAVDRETALLLRQAVVDFEADDAAAVAVLCGADGNFCAGYDLKSLAEGGATAGGGSANDAGGGIEHEPAGEGPMGPSRMLTSKPVIAAVEGYAVAGGLELALWCDLRVAAQTAVFGVFCRRWGVPLIDGGTVRLPRVIGHGRALDMILTGRAVAADEALAFGLANRVVPAGTAREAAVALALEISRFPQLCMRSDLQSAHEQWSLALGAALAREGELGDAALHREGVAGAARFAGGKGRAGSYADL